MKIEKGKRYMGKYYEKFGLKYLVTNGVAWHLVSNTGTAQCVVGYQVWSYGLC